MSHLDNVMNSDDSEDTSVETKVSSVDRIGSIMDMEHEEKEDKSKEPENSEVKSELPLKSKESDDTEEEDSEKEEDKKEKKKEEPKEKKEEEKKEVEKKKIKYKVDGQEIEEELTDEEIASAVSGRKAIQKRFTEIDQQKKEVQRKEQEANETIQYVKKEFSSARDEFESTIKEFQQNGFVKGNPIKGVYNLLDKMGLPAAEFEKAVFFHHLPEVAKFLDMNDAERDAFLLARENEWLKKGQNAVKEREREAAEFKAKLEQENSIKRQAGVSEELFSELKNELSEKGLENLTTEQVIEWHKVKPFYKRAENIANTVGQGDVNKIARILLEFPETTDDWMLEQMGYKKQQEKKIVDELKDKLPPKPKQKVLDETEEEMEFLKQFRRR